MSKVNVFVLIKTSSEDEDEKRLHQDECLLGFTTGPETHTHVVLLKKSFPFLVQVILIQ